MKITTLFVMCKPIAVGLAGITVLGGGALAAINNINKPEMTTPVIDNEETVILEEEPVDLPKEEQIDTNSEVKVELEPETKTTSKSITEKSPNTQKPKTNTPTVPKNTDKVTITKEDPHGAASYNGMSRIQYEDAVKYTCPSQREENVFETYRPAMSRLISIGKYSAYAAIGREVPNNGVYTITGVPQAYLELSWDKYKQYPSQFNGEGSFLVAIENKTIKFYINWRTLTISWGKEDRDKVSTSIIEMADHLSSSWTAYLRSLESSYNSRCPNN